MKNVLIILILIIIVYVCMYIKCVCISNHVVHLKYIQLIFINYPLINLEKEKETIEFLKAYVKMLGSKKGGESICEVNFFTDQLFMRKTLTCKSWDNW